MQRMALRTAMALAVAALIMASSTAMAQDKQVETVKKALPDKAPAEPKQPRKLLIFSRTTGFRHGSIGIGTKAIVMMGDKTGAYTAFATEDESYFEPEKLKAFDAVFMLNTTGEPLKGKGGPTAEAALKKSLTDFVSSGKGLIGVHSATDTYAGWKEYNQMMGGAFAGHPWYQEIPVKNLDPKNPVNAAFEGKDFKVKDEIYQFRADTALPTDRKFLLCMDTENMKEGDVKKGGRKDGLYPVSWISKYGKGRTFYCSLGHGDEIFWNPTVLKHYLAGIQYALGDLEADATPTKAADGGK